LRPFNKKLFFDGKIIKQEKEHRQGEKQACPPSLLDKGNRESSEEIGTLPGWILQTGSDKGKRRGRLPKFGRTTPSAS
jgi:hypothetical protein